MATGIGIELGSSTIRVATLERTGAGSVKVLVTRELPCETSNPEALTRALTQLRRSLHLTQPAVLGLPSTTTMLSTVQPLVPNPRRSLLAVQFELQQQLPFTLDEAVWHYRWISGNNGQQMSGRSRLTSRTSKQGSPASGIQQQAGAVVASVRRSFLDERLASCHRAGLQVNAVAVSSIATLNAWRLQQNPPRPASVAILRVMDEQTAEWIVSTPRWMQVIPVVMPSPETSWQELAASWEALRASVPDAPSLVAVMGSAETTARLQEAMKTQGNLRIERFDLTQSVSGGTTQLDQPERWVAAVGLAVQAVGMAALPLNLIASMQSRRRAQHLHRVAAIVSGISAVVSLGLAVNGMLEVRHRRASILESLERRERLYQTLRPEIRALLQRQEHTKRRTLQLAQLVKEGPVLTQLLAQLAEALPDDVWLTKLECSKSNVTDVVLEGRAKSFQDVTKFFDRLKTVVGMTTVKPLSTNVMTDQSTGKELVAFTVQGQRQPAAQTTGVSTRPERMESEGRAPSAAAASTSGASAKGAVSGKGRASGQATSGSSSQRRMKRVSPGRF